MLKTIEQSVRFAASATELYEIYLDPKRHAAVTGAPVTISPKPGSKFAAFNGMLSGRMLHTIPGRQIVQQWRSVQFYPADLDSILILNFVQERDRARIDMIHANVPNQDHAGVIEGWPKYYWKPLRAYLKRRIAK